MLRKFRGILLYTKVYKENDLFIKFLSNDDEIISGIIYGGLSKKKRNIFQIGFFLSFEVDFKANRPASVKAELTKPYVSTISNDKYKLNCLICVVSLINLSIIEGQIVKDIYIITNEFLNKMFYNKKWLNDFCIYLFKLLKIIGYEVDFSNNRKLKFFNIENLQFNENNSGKDIEFPYDILTNNKNNLKFNQVDQIFRIFENVFVKYHLSNFNLHLPNQYHLFKKLVL